MTRFEPPRLTRRRVIGGSLSAAALLSPALYGLASGFASPARAETLSLPEKLARLRIGEMRKLEPVAAPEAMPVIAFNRADGSEGGLADWRGKALLVNFWATWCAPCVKELPSIDRLAARVEAEGLGDRVAILAISVDRGSDAKPRALFERIGMASARALKLTGMPTTLLVDPEGREVARLLGDADWASAEAYAVIEALATAAGG
jgi:thiol-disulfide isomerase/thioredoxin